MSQTVLPPTDESIETITLDVTGMKCAGCVKAVEKQLTQQPGVKSATVNLVTELATVECDPSIDPDSLALKLTEAGFPSQPRTAESSNTPDLAERRQAEMQRQTKQLAIAILLLVFSTIGHLHIGILGLSNVWFHCGLAIAALIFPGRSMIVDGWQGLRRNAPNMNTLVSLGTLTAFTASFVALIFPQLGWECFFDEPVMLVGFILLGRTLEQRARGQAAAALQSLAALQPRSARLIGKNGATQPGIEIPIAHIRVGEWLQVLPSEQIPVDGEVVLGETTIDESLLTGESIPVQKQVGDLVAAGTINQSGAIAVRVTRVGKDTTLARIIDLVESAQARKAPIQKLADTIAGYFTYGVLSIALCTFLFWEFIGTKIWTNLPQWTIGIEHAHDMGMMPHPSPMLLSLKLAIAVLVIACPCALGLATPTAILVGSGIGAERGLLIRGGDVLEQVHHLDTIVFDKTGTLTTGKPVVTDVIEFESGSVLQLAATVESGTRHPLAAAILKAAENLPLLPAQDFYTQAGFGVSAKVEIDSAQQQVFLGTAKWLENNHIAIPETARSQADQLAAAGKTIVYVATEALIGIIAVSDALRPDAQSTIKALKDLNLRVLMLSGDRTSTAQAIAANLGLSDVFAEIPPEGKASAIAQLQAEGYCVGMVGDGINDAPALAQADVGIALKSGTDVAIETAGIVLMRDRLSDVVESIRLSRATFAKIQQNLFWAFAYNLLGIPIAAGLLLPAFGILLSPAAAGAFMAFSSVSVVTNSLLLRRFSKSSERPESVTLSEA
ncbi:heavy metal translocating P-type ATPase [Leptolyngbya sp. FACHB-17]|uniref:heavy metal translocating P-type ATPase n=1 Tax=unclassified Leptolyngbya TaxID=2650499 RepID=UPI0016812DAD|nr:heavy metal translocating P-type ATPase [Leptolyngbya sp. FACHB-17]MBD2083218.1 copper-translocating P-type ATPase [Leptolyngbya sp. FACHB-17]